MAEIAGIGSALERHTVILNSALASFGSLSELFKNSYNALQQPFETLTAVHAASLATSRSAAEELTYGLTSLEIAVATGTVVGVAASTAETQENLSSKERLERIEATLELIRREANSGLLGLSWGAWQFLLSIFITLLITVWQNQSSQRESDANSEQFESLRAERKFERELLSQIADQLTANYPHATEVEYVVVASSTALRRRPQGSIIERIPRNLVVEMTGSEGKWIRVKYHDHIDGIQIEGWCLKKHLQVLKEEQQ